MLTNEEREIIVDNTNIREYKKGDVILREGQMAKECYMVLKGLIREYYIVDGEEKTTNFFMEMEPVNSFSSRKNNKPSKHFLVCAEDCAVTVSTNSLEAEMCRLIPRLESIIRDAVEKETGKMQEEMANFITTSPEDRYTQLMNEKPELLNRVPQHQIASYLGVKPETLSRIRKRLLTAK
ncbi:MAG: Crp/Fnr family transcriptional regulator [Chitinophagales bacterium]|nr:Crp/Fnr family transcriptional regulator [Chitinophagales bacterium]